MLNIGRNIRNLNYSSEVELVEEFIENNHFEEAIEKCFKIIEDCLECLFQDAFTIMDIDKQGEIIECLKSKYDGKKFNDLTIGKKLRVFEDFKIMKFLGIHFDKEVNILSILKLNDIRVDSTHRKRKITKVDAAHSYSMILRFLDKIDCIITSEESPPEKKVIEESPSEEEVIEEKIEEQKKHNKHKLEKPSYTTKHVVRRDIKGMMRKQDADEYGSKDYVNYKRKLDREADRTYSKENRKAKKRRKKETKKAKRLQRKKEAERPT